MSRIPKISKRNPVGTRDPRLQNRVAERRKLETKKDNVVDTKKRKTHHFDDLFGNEDIDHRKVAASALVAPAPPLGWTFILEQAKENHRNRVINDGEYSTIIRQVFQVSQSKMIRESGPTFPHHREFRYPPGSGSGPYPEPMPGPMQERHMWNDSMGRDPRLGGYPPFENRNPRYEHPSTRGPLMPSGPPRPMASGLSTAFEVIIVT